MFLQYYYFKEINESVGDCYHSAIPAYIQEQLLFTKPDFMSIYNYINGPLFRFDFFNVLVDYDSDPAIKDKVLKQ